MLSLINPLTMRKSLFLILSFYLITLSPHHLLAQSPIAIGNGSYASFPPLEESRSSLHGGCQAYQMEHREIYAVDSLLNRPLPSNDWWTYALVNPWTGKLWAYPALVWADATGISIAKPSYWEPTGCEMKWNAPLTITTLAFSPDSLIASRLKTEFRRRPNHRTSSEGTLYHPHRTLPCHAVRYIALRTGGIRYAYRRG